MKEAYLNAEMDVVEFTAVDIVRCSDNPLPDPIVTEEVTTTFIAACLDYPPNPNAWD